MSEPRVLSLAPFVPCGNDYEDLERAYTGLKLVPPEEFPWCREVNLIDLAGVCWHIATP